MIEIYTDGSCKGNGTKKSSGGFAVIVTDNSETIIETYSHYESNTTNNIMEMKAVLWAMYKYGSKDEPPIVFCDSAYVVNTFNDWMFKWAENGWKKSNNQTPENLNLISAYYNHYNKGFRMNLKKVKGHANIYFNELADKIATKEIDSL